ncbi:MAG TPA: alpha/beta hydrolase [Solimonas sp.]|nr:alpha/beta hydrolase [Solimonas sp.]
MERLDWRAPFRDGAPIERIAGVPVRIVDHADAQRVVLYLHGGGFFMKPMGAHLALLERLCTELRASGVLPDYRLMPEHPYPHGLDDCTRVYELLIEHGVPAHSIIIAGESAGGTLTLALLLRLRERGLPLPACAVLISPGTDMAGIGVHASYRENQARDALVPPGTLPRIVAAYAGEHALTTPELSPLHGDYAGLPPLHFVASRDEVLRDDSVLAAAKAREADVAVELRLWHGMMHAFVLFHRLPEAQQARADIVRFIDTHSVRAAMIPLLPPTSVHSISP